MQPEAFETPVVLIIFKRPETTQRVLDAIAKARPSKLLLVADGPRADKAGEAELCAETRTIATSVNWPCEVLTNFADKNLGCQERVISGLDWAFSQVDEAVILEDDCLPDLSFFQFCKDLLNRYRGDWRVAAISGTNQVESFTHTDDSYFFTQLGGNWGWATWKDEWLRYDRHIKTWPEIKRTGLLAEIFDRPKDVAYWVDILDQMYENRGPNTWDYQWLYAHLVNNALTAVPRVNLVANIGFASEGATHTSEADSRLMLQAKSIEFPLRHPSHMIPMRSLDRRIQDLFYLPLSQRISRKAKSVLKGLVPEAAKKS